MSDVERSKAEIVSRVLERIAEDRYRVDDEKNGDGEVIGEVIIIPDYGPTFLECEEYFSEELDELKLRIPRNESGVDDSDYWLSENWSDLWTAGLLEEWSSDTEEDNARIFAILEGCSYEEVITRLYAILTSSLEEIEGLLAAGRETLPKTEVKKLSGEMDETFRNSNYMRKSLSNFHARRLSKLFPKLIDRAEKLVLLKADYEVPDKVTRYTGEASKSYLNGQWIACLMVCRSAIEFAVRDRLKTSGYGSELDAFERSPNGDSLRHLIELAKKHMAWQYREPLDYAQKVREAAVRAVHVEPPHQEECESMFVLTRTIMQMLYNEPKPL